MGCLCPKLFKSDTKGLNEKLNDGEEAPTPTIEEDLEANHMTIGFSKYHDIHLKRKLAEYLLDGDYNIYKKYLEEVKNLEDEEFYQLFEGNTEFNYNSPNKKEFIQLVQKFDDNKELLSEYYNQEEYYECVLQLWRPNILQKLKSAEDEFEQEQILKKYKINRSKWDDKFNEYFQIIINSKPIKSLAERMKNYLEADYGDFDELIKNVNHCKKNVDKGEKTHCKMTLGANLDTTMNKILNDFVPHFLKQITGEGANILKGFKKKAEENAFSEINEKVFSENDKKKLLDEVKQIYSNEEKKEEEKKEAEKEKKEENIIKDKEEEQKDILSSLFEYNGEYEKLAELGKKFTSENMEFNEEEDEEDELKFKKLTIGDKAEVIFKNKMIKHAVLGLSLANVSYSVLHLAKTFMNYKSFSENFQERLKNIKNNFIKHQNSVKLIDEDIDKAIEQIVECGKNFQQDLLDVEELISDIKDVINGIKTEKNNTILNMFASAGGLLLGIFGMSYTKGMDRVEYASASLADFLALIANGMDLATQNKAIEEFIGYMDEAKDLKNKINAEIDKLRDKFNELKVKHF